MSAVDFQAAYPMNATILNVRFAAPNIAMYVMQHDEHIAYCSCRLPERIPYYIVTVKQSKVADKSPTLYVVRTKMLNKSRIVGFISLAGKQPVVTKSIAKKRAVC